jgi:hypothetical protein
MTTASGMFPLLSEGTGILGLLTRGRVRDPNQARDLFNRLYASNPELAVEAFKEFGPRMGLGEDYARVLNLLETPGKRLEEVIRRQQPTTRYEPRGEKAFPPTEPEPTAPATVAEPPSLAERMFEPPPERGTQVGLPAPREFEDQGPIYGSPQMAALERAAYERRPGTFGAIGGGPATPGPLPEVPPPPSRPVAPALPEAPGPVAPAGPYPRRAPIERGAMVTAPGESIEDIVRTSPQLAGTAVVALPKVQQATLVAQARAAAMEFAQKVKSGEMTVEDAIDTYGETMAASPEGQHILATYDKRAAAHKVRQEERRKEQANQWAESEIARLRATGDPEDAKMAQALEYARHDKEFYTVYHQAREAEAKRIEAEAKRDEAAAKRGEAEKPIMIDDVPHYPVRDADGKIVRNAEGMPQLKPALPEGASKRLWQLKGLDDDKLLALARTHPDPQMRADARAVYDENQQAKLIRSQQQGAGAVKPTQASLEKQTLRFQMTEALDAADRAVRRHPEFIEGPMAAAYWAAYQSPDLVKGLVGGVLPEGYAEFAADLGQFTAEKIHELAGSALTKGEIQRYTAFLPSPWQSASVFRANLAAARRALVLAARFHQKVQTGMSDEQARRETRAELVANLEQLEASRQRQPGTQPSGGVSPKAKQFMDTTGQ